MKRKIVLFTVFALIW